MTARLTPTPHGTWTGYANHGCRCDECRAAASSYMKEYRKTNKNIGRSNRARARAWAKLAAAHPDEFAEILNNERQREGLPPTGTDGRGDPVYVESDAA